MHSAPSMFNVHIDCIFDRAVLRDEMIAWSKKNSSAVDPVAAAAATAGMSNRICRQFGLFHDSYLPPCSTGSAAESASAAAAAENKDREVIIAMVTKAVTAITQRLSSLSTFDGTDSKVYRLRDFAPCRTMASSRNLSHFFMRTSLLITHI